MALYFLEIDLKGEERKRERQSDEEGEKVKGRGKRGARYITPLFFVLFLVLSCFVCRFT